MKRIAATFVAICSAAVLTIGTTTPAAADPDADGGGSASPEPVGVGAPANLGGSGNWSITTTGADGNIIRFGEMPDLNQVSKTVTVASSWWDGQCGSDSSTDGKFDVLKQYNRPKVHSRMSGSKAKMYCGKHVSTQSEAAFGLRHIRAGHKSQFADLAALEGRDWGNFMHWSVSWAISEPGRRTVQNANRYCYQKKFVFVSPNGSSFDRQVVVILGRTGVRIMTAFPSNNTTYCQGTLI